MGFFCPTCGKEQLILPFAVTGQDPCPYCGTIVDLTNAIKDLGEAMEVRDKYEFANSDDED